MTSNPASPFLDVEPEVISWARSVASEVCGGEERSGQRRRRLGPAARYLLRRERGNGEEKPREEIRK